jgi:hypothetical protein
VKKLIYFTTLFSILSCQKTTSQKTQEIEVDLAPIEFSPAGFYKIESDLYKGTLELHSNGTFSQSVGLKKSNDSTQQIRGLWSFNIKQEIHSYLKARIFKIQFKDSIWDYSTHKISQHLTRKIILQDKKTKVLIQGNRHYWLRE